MDAVEERLVDVDCRLLSFRQRRVLVKERWRLFCATIHSYNNNKEE